MATATQNLAVGVPDLSAERAVTWPKRTRAKLSNGLEVVLAEAHSIPKFHGVHPQHSPRTSEVSFDPHVLA